jgi:hypothetical protein
MTVTNMLKSLSNEIGAHLPPSVLNKMGSLLNYFYTGRWMNQRGFSPKVRVRDRIELIRTVAQGIADQEVLYLEFGVWKGESMELWSKLLTNPASRLHGFDSFEGLPEACDHLSASGRPFPKGALSTSGLVPQISDTRVKFFKGWFEDTLPLYNFVPGDVLVVFLDADLYSSTIYVLKALLPHLKVGTIIYFDEFWDTQHEQKAFTEFIEETGMNFEPLVADYGTRHIAFERIG